MQKTESLYPLIVCRSDGQLEHITRTGIKELNQPTTAQQNDTPDANGNVDCYRRLEDASEKGLDWRRKLGGMFKEAIMMDSKEHSKKRYVLKELPEGYTLWEHVKYNKKKMDTEDKKKEKGRHAAGIYERQDAYLYGHPLGRKKRFRSPVEFFPHLLWLAVDKEGDPANCSCKICYPEKDEVQTPEDAVKEIPKPEPVEIKPPVKKEPKPAPSSSNSRSVPSSSTAPPPPPAAPVRATATPSKPPTARPTNGRSPEATADGDPDSKYFYRPGELVWFNNGLNWRLGVIGRRGLLNEHPRYLIQPLSNPLQHQPPQIKTDQKTSLRPWLAWSAPLPTISQINNISFDKIPWERVITGEFNDGRKPDYVVDGSILAAKMIDASYSLFDRNDHALAGPGEVHYNGMFFGAEKIWVGEPVRLRVKVKAVPDIVVMVVQKLIERTVQGRSSVTFVGDVYKLVQMPSPYTNRSQWPTPDLPARMVADLRYRNEVADDAHANIWSEWRLLEPAARKELADIRGRWYEARTLLPILRGAEKYEEDKRSGKILDVGLFMNGRLDNNGVPEQRRKNRRDTVGASVPAGFKFSRGLDGLPAENVFPDEQQLQAPLQLDDANDLDQFMDLDGAGQNFYV